MNNLNRQFSRGARAFSFPSVMLVVLALWLCPAEAFMPPNVSILDMAHQSDIVLVGTMGKIQDGRAQFSVEQVLKGEVATPVVEVTPVTTDSFSHTRPVQEGQTLVLFLTKGTPLTIITEGWGVVEFKPETKEPTIAAVQHFFSLPPRSEEDALARAMLALATSDNFLLRSEAHRYIVSHLKHDQKPFPYEKELITLLKHPDSDVRRAAIQGLHSARSEEALPLIIEITHGEDVSLLQAASTTLAPYDTPESVAALIALTRHANPEVRISALINLDSSRRPEAKAALIALVDDSSPRVRSFVPRGMMEWIRRGETREAFPRIVTLLNDPAPEVQVAAADILGKSSSALAVEPLFFVLGRKELSPELEQAAMTSLSQIYRQLDASSRPPLGNKVALVDAVLKRGRGSAGLRAIDFLVQVATPEALTAVRHAAQNNPSPNIRDYAQRELPVESVASEPKAKLDRAFYPKSPHLLIIERRLRKIILEAHPEATIEFIGNELVVHYRSEKYRTHLIDASGNISKAAAGQFPDDFSEFLLRLGVEEDVMYYRPGRFPDRRPKTFGSTLSQRYNLKDIPAFDPAIQSPDVPPDHWTYLEYDKLAAAGFVRKRYPEGMYNGPPIVMTRYEFAVAIARFLDEGAASPTAKTPIGDHELNDALTALQEEFAPEISALGLSVASRKPVIHGYSWQSRHQHLSLRVSYGKGMKPVLLDKIQQVIEDHAASVIKQGQSLYTVNDYPIEVTLAPDQPVIMLGEPLHLSFVVHNRSDQDLEVMQDGTIQDPKVRPARFTVTVSGEGGERLPEPHGKSYSMGRFEPRKLPAQGSFTFKLFLPHWAVLDRPGIYTVTAERFLQVGTAGTDDWTLDDRTTGTSVQTSTTIKVVPADAGKIGALIAALGESMLKAPSEESHDAIYNLSYFQDERVIPYLATAVEKGNYGLKYWALGQLAKYKSDAALQALKEGMETTGKDFEGAGEMRYPDQMVDNIRNWAANALAQSKHPEAIPYLISYLHDPSETVRTVVLRAISRLKPEVAFPLLQEMTQDPSPFISGEAKKVLRLLPSRN